MNIAIHILHIRIVNLQVIGDQQNDKANDDGDIIGHDMCEAKAKALAAEMQEKEPDASREAMNGEDE